jgi:hypothetical protein
MPNRIPLPIQGRIAFVSQRHYLVEGFNPPPRLGDSTLVQLSCVDDDNQRQPLQVLWEQEINPAILNEETWESVAKRGFDDSQLFAAYFNTLR